MEIKDMSIADIEERMSAISAEIETDGADLDALQEEVRSLKEHKAAIEAEETRKAEIRKAVAEGAGAIVMEIPKEDRKTMENIEVRNSVEYGKAFCKAIMTGDDAEARALLSVNATSGTIPVPQFLDDEIRNAWEECQLMSLVKRTGYAGNVKVGFEYSAGNAVVHTEGAAAPDEEALVLGTVEIKAESLKKWITISDEAIEGTTIDTLGYIYKEIAQKIVELAESTLIGKIEAAPATSSTTAPAVPVYTAATLAVDTITMALAELSGKAKNVVLAMNRRTYAAFKAAAKNNKYGVDPFDGCKVVFSDAIKAYSAATTGETYVIAGDFGYGAQANFPSGNDMQIKVDDLSLAEKDLVKVVGRQYVGMAVVAPKAFVKVQK